jgi:hypothetical protein
MVDISNPPSWPISPPVVPGIWIKWFRRNKNFLCVCQHTKI